MTMSDPKNQSTDEIPVYGELTDEALTELADATFVELDLREAEDESSNVDT